MSNGTSTLIIKIGLGALLIQNVLLVAILGGVLLDFVLYIDLAGFLLLGIGLILRSREGEANSNLMFAGLGVLGWVAARVTWQFILVDSLSLAGETSDWETALENVLQTLLDMATAFLVSALLLALGAFFYFRSKEGGSTIFFVYALFNFIATYLFASPFLGVTLAEAENAIGGLFVGLLLKLLVIPILGVITFLIMILKFDKE